MLVTGTTDPDWMPIMKRAAAIVTDHGGRTSHAAIVSRELGLPAIVGTGNATEILHDEQEVTVSCAEGDEGFVYEGRADYAAEDTRLEDIPATRTKVMLNLANPAAALRWWRIPADGVGLARMEFVVSNAIRIHPMALVHFDGLKDDDAKHTIAELTRGYATKTEYFAHEFGTLLRRTLARLRSALDDPPYNFVIDSADRQHLGSPHVHWRLRIAPKLAMSGGFELGSAMAINPSSPEQDAAVLRVARTDDATQE